MGVGGIDRGGGVAPQQCAGVDVDQLDRVDAVEICEGVIEPARRYRQWLIQHGEFVSLITPQHFQCLSDGLMQTRSFCFIELLVEIFLKQKVTEAITRHSLHRSSRLSSPLVKNVFAHFIVLSLISLDSSFA